MKQLAATEVHALVQALHADGRPALLLDVREPWEVAQGSIAIEGAEARHLPMGSIPARLGELDAQQPVVCICHHGMRSAQVANFLMNQGFTNIVNIQGGIHAWSQERDPAVPVY